MSALSSLLEKFHGAILTKEAEVMLPEIKPHPRLTAERQLAVYIEGYRLRLTQAIRSDYPALLALLGEKTFEAWARDYIEHAPPEHFSLDRYPHRFAAFVRERMKDAFAAELATLEAAIAEVFMREESEPLDPSALTGLTPEAFSAFVLRPRVASRLLSFSYPVNDWLNAERSNGVIERPLPADTYLYVYRHQNNVQRAPLGEAAYRLLEQLAEGSPVGEAFEQLGTAHGETIAANLQTWFTEWMANGFFRK